jgi:Myo-inositol-1-phosphate synthase
VLLHHVSLAERLSRPRMRAQDPNQCAGGLAPAGQPARVTEQRDRANRCDSASPNSSSDRSAPGGSERAFRSGRPASWLTARMLGLQGWYSTNILGNRDGEVLDDPGSFGTKEETKLGVLDDILQPSLHPHLLGEEQITHLGMEYYQD